MPCLVTRSTILDYLRSRTMSIDLFALSKVERSELRTELEFYGIASLLEMMGRGRGLCFDIDGAFFFF